MVLDYNKNIYRDLEHLLIIIEQEQFAQFLQEKEISDSKEKRITKKFSQFFEIFNQGHIFKELTSILEFFENQLTLRQETNVKISVN